MTQFIWGPHAVDHLLCIQTDTDLDGNFEDLFGAPGSPGAKAHYALRDRRGDVIGLVDHTGALKERVRYSAYGIGRHEPFGDTNRSGGVSASDRALVQNAIGGELAPSPFDQTDYDKYDPDLVDRPPFLSSSDRLSVKPEASAARMTNRMDPTAVQAHSRSCVL